MNTVNVDQSNNLSVLCKIICSAGAAITNENNIFKFVICTPSGIKLFNTIFNVKYTDCQRSSDRWLHEKEVPGSISDTCYLCNSFRAKYASDHSVLFLCIVVAVRFQAHTLFYFTIQINDCRIVCIY